MRRLAGNFALVAVSFGTGVAGCALAAEPSAKSAFINTVAQSGMMEVEAARVAARASRSTAVKEFAYRLIYDHESMNADLARIASKAGVRVPAAPDAEHAGILRSLQDSPPLTFDTAYFTQVIRDHARVVELLQSNLLNPDTELAVFSSYNLPRLRAHQRLAEELKAGL